MPLQYAKAAEVADTLTGLMPPGLRIAPYPPTNSLIIAGDPRAVGQLITVLSGTQDGATTPEPEAPFP